MEGEHTRERKLDFKLSLILALWGGMFLCASARKALNKTVSNEDVLAVKYMICAVKRDDNKKSEFTESCNPRGHHKTKSGITKS